MYLCSHFILMIQYKAKGLYELLCFYLCEAINPHHLEYPKGVPMGLRHESLTLPMESS